MPWYLIIWYQFIKQFIDFTDGKVTLSCGTNIQWFFCIWRGPNGNKQCALQQNQESNPQNICEDDDGGNRITLKGSRTNCDIELKDVQVSDFGTWQCIVTDDVNFQTDKTKIALEVGQAANVKFSQNFGKDSTLIITEGDSVSVSVLFKVTAVISCYYLLWIKYSYVYGIHANHLPSYKKS